MKQEFFVVATPIGNLGDITARALEILSLVDLILCEDTRETRKLLNHYGIKTPTISYHARSDTRKSMEILERIGRGEKLALVTDAGTPGISDPGSELVSVLREKFPGLKINSVPGPSALTAALSIAGLPSSEFVFLGFLPNKKGRETLFKEIAGFERTVVFYESPHRIMKTLEKLRLVLGGEWKMAVCREMTKVFESVVFGSPDEAFRHFEDNLSEVRGEFVVVLKKNRAGKPARELLASYDSS